MLFSAVSIEKTGLWVKLKGASTSLASLVRLLNASTVVVSEPMVIDDGRCLGVKPA